MKTHSLRRHLACGCLFLSLVAGVSPSVIAAPRNDPPATPSLYQDVAEGLFTVKCDDGGGGSGFFCEVDGRTVCMTNAHVLSGSKKLAFATPAGEAIVPAVDQFHVAGNRDLAYFPLKTPRRALKLCAAMNRLNIGDEVVCFGNSDGRFSITDIRGKIVGVGPDLIEVDFPIPSGNSGSPLIHAASREVIGVATYSLTATASTSDKKKSVRRDFCMRVDGSVWKPQSWKSFSEEAAFVDAYCRHTRQVGEFVSLLPDGIAIDLNRYDEASVALRSSLRGYLEKLSNTKFSASDRLRARMSLIAAVDHQARRGPFGGFDAVRKRAAAMISFYHREKLTGAYGAIRDRESICAKLREWQTTGELK